MKAYLQIPFADKDNAKAIAREHKCALYFTQEKHWELIGEAIPADLEKYVFKVEGEAAPSKSTAKPSTFVPRELYTYVLDVPFMLKETVSGLGCRWDPENKVYLLKATHVPKELERYKSRPYSYEAWIEKQLNDGKPWPEGYPAVSDTSITPRDYQSFAHKIIHTAIQKELNGFLLADEVGLGKTISAGLVAKEKEFETILVVTTLSACAHWRRTFLRMSLDESKDIIIINYDKLQKLFKLKEGSYKAKAKTKRTRNKRLATKGEAPEFDLIIWDESHKMKNNTAMRSKLGRKLADSAEFNLWLSATAGQNPLELSYLAPLLATITKQSVKGMEEFEKWCLSMGLGISRGEFGKWLWDGSQESIDKIHNLLFKTKPQAALRRTPSDLIGYPEISRDLTPLELNPEEQSQYQLAWQEFKASMRNIQAKPNKKTQKGEDNVLVAKLRLRQKASILKVPYTVEYIEDLLEKGHQVAVSVNFKEAMFEIEAQLAKSKIKCSKIYGELGETAKEAERLKFQKGENKVVLFTVEEAISLHQGEYNDAPRSMLIHDLRWSAIQMSQIEGRTHRDGKFSQIYWLYFVDSIEEDIAKIVLNRVIGMKGMVGDDTQTLREIEATLISKD